jgi:trans-2,3-dihydro-3-hydroxyanthranilate isomerase
MSNEQPATFAPSRSYDYAQVDVFAEQPLAGNALAIFTDARGLTTGQMQAIARETNLCETTFILPRTPEVERERGVHVRIFTVREELRFAGHPTLGTASWIHLNHPVFGGAANVTLDLRIGPIPVTFASQQPGPGVYGTMRQNDPAFGEIHEPLAIAAALGLSPDDLDPELPIQTVSTGMAFASFHSDHSKSPRASPSHNLQRKPISHAATQNSSIALREHPPAQASTGTRACSSTTEKILPPGQPPAAPSHISSATHKPAVANRS